MTVYKTEQRKKNTGESGGACSLRCFFRGDIFHKADHQSEISLTIRLCTVLRHQPVDLIHISAVDGFIIPAAQWRLHTGTETYAVV